MKSNLFTAMDYVVKLNLKNLTNQDIQINVNIFIFNLYLFKPKYRIEMNLQRNSQKHFNFLNKLQQVLFSFI